MPTRRAAAAKTKYADVSSDDEESDSMFVSTSAASTSGTKKKAAPKSNGRQKGKGKAKQPDDLTVTESDSDRSLTKSAQRKTAKPKSASKSREVPSASKLKKPLAKSKSEGNVADKKKGSSRINGNHSDSSDVEDLFSGPAASPSKETKSLSKAKTPVKKPAAATKQKATLLTARPISANSSDDDLPALPFSSQPPPNSQTPKPFDLLDIDDDAFVAIPARRKAAQNSSTPLPSTLLRFWWPAKVVNRNRRNFTVSPILDEPEKEILKFR